MDIQQLFSESVRKEASDLHLVVGYPDVEGSRRVISDRRYCYSYG